MPAATSAKRSARNRPRPPQARRGKVAAAAAGTDGAGPARTVVFVHGLGNKPPGLAWVLPGRRMALISCPLAPS